MTVIRCIYASEPNFPATDQHPDAVRYQVGDLWVDAIGGEPTQEEIDAVLIEPPEVDRLQLVIDELATKPDASVQIKALATSALKVAQLEKR